MKKVLLAALVAVFMVGLIVSCEKETGNDEIYEIATDGDEVKRPGGGS